jgi:hypothetical protein
LKIVGVIEEQMSVSFTGKVNILSNFNRQYLGHLVFSSGEIIKATFQGHRGTKAFFQIIVQEYSLNSFVYIVEPEIVDELERDIFLPYASLKLKMEEVIRLYRDSIKLRPPDHVRIVLNADFMEKQQNLAIHEFTVMLTLTEWSSPFDVYQHCPLLDHEITYALVGLRKKEALKIVAAKGNLG